MGDQQKNTALNGQECPQKGQAEKDSRRISPSVLRIMVVFYILWIIKELVLGIFKREADKASPWLLGIAAGVLFIGAAGLLYLEWRDKKKRER
ncbi:MAG: hypothetical protein HFE84_07765 [Lachnospiraceae bacterium]|nr:hypothetical protein [Lachnospiraceae bacterium]